MRRLLYSFACLWTLTNAYAQMQQMGETRYGPEWINPDRPYFKIGISTDGLYRIPYQYLVHAGIPVDTIPGVGWQLYHLGQEQPLFVSSGDQPLGPGDFLEFYATKNRGELDRFLFSNPETEQHNPAYSLFSDATVYFLSWGTAQGKRVHSNALPGQLTGLPPYPNTYCMHATWVESSAACQPPDFGNYTLLGTYTAGEGFGSYRALRYDKLLTLDDSPEYGQTATLHIRLSSWPGTNKLRFLLNGIAVLDTILEGPVASRILLPAVIYDESLRLSIEASQPISVAVLQLDYQTVKMDALPVLTPFSRSANLKSDTLFSAMQGLLYTLSSGVRIQGKAQNGLFIFFMGGLPSTEKLLFVPESKVVEITELKRLRPLDFSEYPPDYLILAPPVLADAARAYAHYRTSREGGGYHPILLDMELVQDYFAYGIPLHPLGIRNLVHYLESGNKHLQGIFILGKGLEYPAFRTLSEIPAWLVPAFGAPASDNLYGMSQEEASPHTPVGRLAATTSEEVYDYLQKVKELEAAPHHRLDVTGWPKQVLHLGGGLQPSEKQAIRSYLDAASALLAEPPLGLHTHSFFKNTLHGLPATSGDTIRYLIEQGVSLLTFFGHSGSNTFDYSINQPTEIKNQGRYPVIMALGCSAGQIFGSYRSLSEDYVLEPLGGSVAFIGTSTSGDLFSMGAFIQDFYRSINRPEPEFRVGVWLRDALKAFSVRVSVLERGLIQTLVLHGDPLLRLPFRPAPDFVGVPESVQISPLEINELTDTARISLRVRNLGRSMTDSLDAVLEVRQPDTIVWQQVLRMPAPLWEDTLAFDLPIRNLPGIGRYALHLNLNPFHSTPEWPYPEAEENNAMVLAIGTDSVVLQIQEEIVSPLNPPDYGVVDTVGCQLLARTGTVSGRFYMELDTTSGFAAPQWQDTLSPDSTGILRGVLDFVLDSGQTYFWRCISLDDSSRIFFVRSFTCMPGTTANWLMRHFDQFSDCELRSLELDTIQRIIFSEQQFIVHALTGRYPDVARPEIAINHVPSRFFPYNIPRFDAGFYAAVFDRRSGAPWKNEPGGLYGSQLQIEPHPAVQDFYAFPFSTTSREGRRRFLHFLDTIPPGNQVLLLSVSDQGQSLRANEWGQDSLEWGRTLFGVMEQQGARQVRRLQEAPFLPYLLLFQKDSPAFSRIERLADVGEESAISFSVHGQSSEGVLKSPLIGPARRWERLEWALADTTHTRQGFMQVWAVGSDGREKLVLDSLYPGRYSLQQIDTTQYPYLYVQVKVWDKVHYLPPQSAYWALHYERTPALFLQLPQGIKQPGAPVQVGEPLRVMLDIFNTGSPSVDSTEVCGVLYKGEVIVGKVLQRLPVPAKKSRLELYFPGQEAGHYRLEVEINKNREVLEAAYHDNRVAQAFVVEPDQTAPSVSVQVDGRTMASGDLVGTYPEIQIRLNDPPFSTLLTDTALLEVFFRRPNHTDFERLTFGAILSFYPPKDGAMNEARAVFQPELGAEGWYELVVRGRDMAGNRAPEQHLVFEVLPAPQLLHWDAFPNPFTNQVRFRFFLSGTQVPALFRVHIFSQEGRRIRTLGAAELGAIHLGRNETSGGWDGTDESGHPVPAGIYLCVPELPGQPTDIRPLMVRVLLVR